ncbi:MAG: hypothetical protein HOW73_47810 [Polyangiaceae bacterium]|nr:hypothetical protein [Polyangiaceae bacterium]
MGSGLFPSVVPPAPGSGPGLAATKPARGGESPRGLSATRKAKREEWAGKFDAACKATGTTNAAITRALDNVGDKLGNEVRTGKAAVTSGEAIALLPLEAAAIADAEMWSERYAREAALTEDPLRQQLLDLLLTRRAEERKLLTALAQTRSRIRAA